MKFLNIALWFYFDFLKNFGLWKHIFIQRFQFDCFSLIVCVKVHVTGVGDFFMSELHQLDDPLPLPEKREDGKRGSLGKRHKMLYAPMSDIESVLIDSDAVYIDIPEHHIAYSAVDGAPKRTDEELGEGERMVRKLQNTETALDDKLAASSMQLLRGSVGITAAHLRSRRAAPSNFLFLSFFSQHFFQF